MKLINEKVRDNKLRCLFQFSLSIIFVFLILFSLDIISNAVVIASFGSSALIAFTFPQARVSHPRFLIGGYFIGIAAGSAGYFLLTTPAVSQLPVIQSIPFVFFGALAVGLAIFGMVLTDTVHPPSASLALGLVVHQYSILTVVIVFIGVVLLAAAKEVLKPFLKNLL